MLATTFHLVGFRDWFMPLGEGSSRPVTPSLWSSPSCRVPCGCRPPGPNSGAHPFFRNHLAGRVGARQARNLGSWLFVSLVSISVYFQHSE